MIAVKTRGDLLPDIITFHEVPRQLLHGELIKWLIGVVGIDDVIPPQPHETLSIGMKDTRITVAGQIHPCQSHALTELVPVEKSIHHTLVGSRIGISQKRIQLPWGRWEAGQVKGHPSNQGCTIGFGVRGQSLAFQFGENKTVDRIAHPGLLLHLGKCGQLWRLKRPVPFPRSALFNPFFEQGPLIIVQGHFGLRGRHDIVLIVRKNPLDQQTLGRISSLHHPTLARVSEETLARVQPQIGFSFGFVRSVAGKTMLGEQWENIAIEYHFFGLNRYEQGRGDDDPPRKEGGQHKALRPHGIPAAWNVHGMRLHGHQ